MTLVTNLEYYQFIIEKLLPAIKEKWSSNASDCTIKIQHDNVRPHITPMDVQFYNAVRALDLNVRSIFQPPNSTDMNVLDLVYFNAIQSLQYKAASQNIGELILAVYESFEALHWSKLNDIFLTLQKVMEICILHDGRNDCKLPHMSKRKLENLGQLPMSIKVNKALENKINTLQTP